MTSAEQRADLDDLLDSISVLAPGQWDNALSLTPLLRDWWAVCADDGIIAYFLLESDAFAFRLSYINRLLNPCRSTDA